MSNLRPPSASASRTVQLATTSVALATLGVATIGFSLLLAQASGYTPPIFYFLWGLILPIAMIGALVTGIRALRKTRRRGGRSRVLAIIGTTIGAIGTALVVYFVAGLAYFVFYFLH